jgi:hypothetical protein
VTARLQIAPRFRSVILSLVASLFVSGLVAGCGSSSASTPADGPQSSGQSRGQSTTRPPTSATLQILTPAPNQRTGTGVDVTLKLDHAHVVPASQIGGSLRGDEGHIHLTVDGQLVAMPMALADSLPRLTRGSHTLEAEFVASDHLAFANRVVAAVTFDVR